MQGLIRLYNQNRRAFWLAILAIIVIGYILWRLLYIFTQNKNSYTEIIEETQTTNSNQNYNSIIISEQKSVITNQKVNIKEDQMSIIDNFISYCNSGKTKEAYSLISDECKEEMYPKIQIFEELYYKPIFGKVARNASITNWAYNIYKVELKEDALATGRTANGDNRQDYITLVEDDEENTKLNINSYIGRTMHNKIVSNDYINIKLVHSDAYMDYETYTFEVENKTNQKIALGNSQNTNMSYLIDKNEKIYSSYNTDVDQEELVIASKAKKTIKIKYFNRFISTRQIKTVVFPRIILNYNIYGNNHRYEKISIDL